LILILTLFAVYTTTCSFFYFWCYLR